MLVTGVGGGVATMCVQFAAALGAEVWVTSGSAEKVEKAKELGAAGGLATSAEDYAAQLKGLSGSFDLVIDSIGGKWFRDYVRMTRQGGRIVSFGATAGPVPELVMPTLFLRHIDVLDDRDGERRRLPRPPRPRRARRRSARSSPPGSRSPRPSRRSS